MKNILIKLYNIQQELKAPKNHYSNFGNYKYRSLEDILDSVKKLMLKERCILTLINSIENIGKYNYVTVTARLIDIDTEEYIEVSGRARETESRPKFDEPQLTGAAISYAGKYALNGLFAIDDTKDSDALSGTEECKEPKEPIKPYVNNKTLSQKQLDFIIKLINQKKYTGEQKQKILEKYNVGKLEELTSSQAKELIDILNK